MPKEWGQPSNGGTKCSLRSNMLTFGNTFRPLSPATAQALSVFRLFPEGFVLSYCSVVNNLQLISELFHLTTPLDEGELVVGITL